MDSKAYIEAFVLAFVAVLIAVSLLPVLATTIAAANLSGTNATLLGLITTFVVIGILYFLVKVFFT